MVVGVVGIAATCRWYFETDEVRDQRAQRRNQKELRALADKISAYGRNVHQRYPTGDVVVCERDLAEQLRKRPDSPERVLEALRLISSRHRAWLHDWFRLSLRGTAANSRGAAFSRPSKAERLGDLSEGR